MQEAGAGSILFKLYAWRPTTIGLVTLIVTAGAGFFVYRPFCSLICPFGLWAWHLTHVSLFKIKSRDKASQP